MEDLLEQDGLIQRKVFAIVPPKVEYSLTSFGKTLYPVLKIMCDWGRKHMPEQQETKSESTAITNDSELTKSMGE